jgi:hypothetical protein
MTATVSFLSHFSKSTLPCGTREHVGSMYFTLHTGG